MANRLDIFYPCKKELVLKSLVSTIVSLALILTVSGSAWTDDKGNTKLQSFNKAKKILLKQVYQDHHTTFYCQCPFTKDKKVLHSSGYVPKKKWKRLTSFAQIPPLAELSTHRERYGKCNLLKFW